MTACSLGLRHLPTGNVESHDAVPIGVLFASCSDHNPDLYLPKFNQTAHILRLRLGHQRATLDLPGQ
jgi:hypothetical protein